MSNDKWTDKDNMDVESIEKQLSSVLHLSGTKMKKNPSFGPLDETNNNSNHVENPLLALQHFLTISDIAEPTCLCAINDFLIIGYYSNSLGKVAVIRTSNGKKSSTNTTMKKALRRSDNGVDRNVVHAKPTINLSNIRSQSDSSMIPRGRKGSIRSNSDSSMSIDDAKPTHNYKNYGNYETVETKTVAITPIRNITAWNQSNLNFAHILSSSSSQFAASSDAIQVDSMPLEEVTDFRSQSMELENPSKSANKKHGHDFLNFENGELAKGTTRPSNNAPTTPVSIQQDSNNNNTKPPYTILLVSSDEVIQLWCINKHNGKLKSITRNNRNLQINISFTLPVHSNVISKLSESDFIFAQDGSVNTGVEGTVWSGHLDGRIIVWNNMGQPIKIIYEGTSAVCSLCLWENYPARSVNSEDTSGVIVSGHESGALRLWSKTATLLATFDTSKYATVRPPPTQDFANNNNNNTHSNGNGSLANGQSSKQPVKAFGPNPFRRSYPTLKTVLKITHLCVWKKNLCCAIFDQLGKVFVQIWNIQGKCLSYTSVRTNQPFYGFLVWQERLCVARDTVSLFEALPSWHVLTKWIWAGHFKNSESFFGRLPSEVVRKILVVIGSDALSEL